jgi:hypothetical protein
MTLTKFNDFGELYRAAFAETDAQRKLSLLHEVQMIINKDGIESNDEPGVETEAA